MWQQVGFLADVFGEFKRHGLSIDLVGTAETNVTVSLDPTENLVNSDVLSALAADLAKVCRVKVIAPCAAITLVGRGMRSLLHRLSGVLAEFGALDVHLICQSSNNLNLTFVIDEALGRRTRSRNCTPADPRRGDARRGRRRVRAELERSCRSSRIASTRRMVAARRDELLELARSARHSTSTIAPASRAGAGAARHARARSIAGTMR